MGAFDDLIPGAAKPAAGAFEDLIPVAPKRTAADLVRDVGVIALKGAVGLPQAVVGLADIPTGGRVGKFLEEAGYRPGETQEMLAGWYSDAQRAANAKVQDADGFIPTLKAAIENPSTIATTIGESLPQMLGGAAIARGIMAVAPKVAPWIAGALGEGVVGAGSAASQIREQTEDGLLTPKHSLAAAASGVGAAVLGAAGGRLSQKLGIGDIDTMLASKAGGALPPGKTAAGFLKAVVGGGISEGVFEEPPQSVQEQMFSNYALDRPLTEGVGNAAAMGLLSGAAMGGGAGGYSAATARRGAPTAAAPESAAPGAPAGPAGAPPVPGSSETPDLDRALESELAKAQPETGAAPAAPAAPAGAAAPVAPGAAPVSADEVLGTVPRGSNEGADALNAAPRTLTALDRVQEIDAKIADAQDQEAPELQQLRQERAALTRDWPATVPGAPASFSTETGARLEGQYALIESDDMVTSHDRFLRRNAAYPQDLQPRERERAASEMQISSITQRLDPARLGASADAATGAPIIGADGLVESGNARSIALSRVYAADGEKAEEYRGWLRGNAEQFGLSADQVGAMRKPVLVRVRSTPVNRAEFARQANASTVAAMSPTEQARSDAARVDSMDDLRPDDDGNFATSRSFISRFVGRLPATERGAMVDADGQLSSTGYARVRNAVLAKAYGDSPVLAKMVESLQDDQRNVSRALLIAAPRVAQAREAIEAGRRHPADITPHLMAAVTELGRLREAGRSVDDALAQQDIGGEARTPEAATLMRFLAENARRPRRIADFLTAYHDGLDAAGDPGQASLLDDGQAPTVADLIEAAQRQVEPPAAAGAGPAAANDSPGAPAWRDFPAESGTLGIPRAKMPQVKVKVRPQLYAYLEGRGISSRSETVQPDSLKPTQAEFSPTKVQSARELTGDAAGVLVSSDGYVLDGHHRWLAKAANGEPVDVRRFDAPIDQLLDAVREFSGTTVSNESDVLREARAGAVERFYEAVDALAKALPPADRATLVPEGDAAVNQALDAVMASAAEIVGTDPGRLVEWVSERLRSSPATKGRWNRVTPAAYRKAAVRAGAQFESLGPVDRILDRYLRFGGEVGSAQQGVQQAAAMLGLPTPSVTADASLNPRVRAAVDLANGEIVFNPAAKLSASLWAQVMVEEMLHRVDLVGPRTSMSVTSRRLGVGGDLRQEAEGVYRSGRGLADFLFYPMKEAAELGEARTAAELFARLGAIYHWDPPLMRRELPLAFEAFHAVFGVTQVGSDQFVQRALPGAGRSSSERAVLLRTEPSDRPGVQVPVVADQRAQGGREAGPADRGSDQLGTLQRAVADVFGARREGGDALGLRAAGSSLENRDAAADQPAAADQRPTDDRGDRVAAARSARVERLASKRVGKGADDDLSGAAAGDVAREDDGAAGGLNEAVPTRLETGEAQAADAPAGEADRGQSGDGVAMLSRTMGDPVPELEALSELDDLFAIRRLNGTTISEIAFDLDPTIKVAPLSSQGTRKRWRVTLPNGAYGDISVLPPNRFGPRVYGFSLQDGDMADTITERPGDRQEAVDESTEDVWIDVSQMKTGQGGAKIYAIAGAFAHNTGRMFIGDPNGISPAAMRRRSENMLSLALRYGTTDFLAPHPDQIRGDKDLGVPPLRWTYGDDEANIKALIAVNVGAMENAFPDIAKVEFDAATGEFRNAVSGARIDRDRLVGRAVERRKEGADDGALGRAQAAGRTVARAVVLRSLSRAEGGQGEGRGRGRNRGLLDRLGAAARGPGGSALRGLFSRSRGGADALSDRSQAADQSAGRGMPQEALQRVADRVAAKLPGLPQVNVLASPAEAPPPLRDFIERRGATRDVEGALYEGEIYLFASGLTDETRAEFVLAEHEAAHAGLRGLLGPGLTQAMQAIANQNASVRASATRLQAANEGMTLAEAVEEVLVDIPTADLAKLRGWRSLVARLRDALAKLGFERMAGAIDTFLAGSLTEQQRADLMAAELVRAARGYVQQRRASATGGTLAPVLSDGTRRPPPANPDPDEPSTVRAWRGLKQRAQALTSPENVAKLVYELQDKFIDLRNLREHIEKLGGTITDLNDAYLGEELYHKRLAKRTDDFLKTELRPLLGDMRNRGIDRGTLEQFLHARHAREANRVLAERNPTQEMIDAGKEKADAEVRALEVQLQGAKARGGATRAIEEALQMARDARAAWNGVQAFKGTEEERLSLSGMSDAEAEAFIEGLPAGQRSHLDELAGRVDAINAKTVDTLERYGLMDKATLDAWRATYQHYVPLHRDEAHPDSVSHPIGQGFSTKGDAAKRRVGSNAKVTNILAHVAMQRESALTRGEKNLVAKRLYLMAAQNPAPEWWAVDKPPTIKTVDTSTGFVRSGVDPLYKNRPNVVMVRIAGKDAAVVFNERNPAAARLAQSIKSQDLDDLGAVTMAAGRFTRLIAAMSTQYNPVFSVVNFVRDVQGGILNLTNTPMADRKAQVFRDIFPALRAIYGEVRASRRGKAGPVGPWVDLWQRMQQEGGTTGYRDLYIDASDRVKALQGEIEKADRGRIMTALDHFVIGWVSDLNEAVENSVRLAVYKAATDSGLSAPRAASQAKNITVNFNRKGRQSAKLGAWYAFFNAAIQGNTRMVETLRGPMGRRIIAGGIGLGALNTLFAVAALGGDGDDDEYKNLPEFVKSRNLIIPLGGKEYVTIPLPLGFHVLPNIGRLLTEYALGRREDATTGETVGEMLAMVLDAFNPLGGSENLAMVAAPTPLDIPVGLMMNRDWQNRPIARENRSDQDPQPAHKLTRDTASAPSKAVSQALNWVGGGNDYTPGAKILQWTPDQIDYVIGQLAGGLGREVVKSLQVANSAATGDELPPYKIPLIGRFYGSTEGPSGQATQYHENVRRLNLIDNEIRGRARDEAEGTLEPGEKTASEFAETQPLAVMLTAASRAERQIQALRQQRARLVRQAEPGYQDEVKRINEQIGEVMGELNREVARVRREAKEAKAAAAQ